jgi:cytochrome P450
LILGNIPDLDYPRVQEAFLRLALQYGPVVKLFLGPHRPSVMVTCPDAARDLIIRGNPPKDPTSYDNLGLFMGKGLLSLSPKLHKPRRHVLNAAFHKDYLAGMHHVMVERSAGFIDRLVDRGGASFDLMVEITKLTLDIIGDTAFSYDFGCMSDASAELPTALLRVLVELDRRALNPLRSLFFPLKTWQLKKDLALLHGKGRSVIRRRVVALKKGTRSTRCSAGATHRRTTTCRRSSSATSSSRRCCVSTRPAPGPPG